MSQVHLMTHLCWVHVGQDLGHCLRNPDFFLAYVNISLYIFFVPYDVTFDLKICDMLASAFQLQCQFAGLMVCSKVVVIRVYVNGRTEKNRKDMKS